MKTLFIIRHAKSSWEDPELDDFKRPLNERGKNDAPRMGKRLKERNIHPDLMITSPAKRAFSTAKRMAKILKYKKDKIKADPRLYHAHEELMLSVIQDISNKHNTVLLFGHNPGLTDFVNSLNAEEYDIENVPTCGVVAFGLKIDNWKDLTWGTGHMIFFDYPKNRED